MNSHLHKKAKNGLLTMSASSLIVFILQFLTTIILARIYSPTQFGIVSAVTIITSYTDIFWKIGMGPALIQKKDLTKNDINTCFFTSVLFGTIATVVIMLLSPYLIKFVNIENKFILRIIALSFFINSFSVVPLSLLQREMDFVKILKNDIFSNITYTISAIIFGYIGMGVWALIIALLLRYLVSTIISLYFCPVKVNMGFNKNSFKSMIRFGFGYSISQFLSVTTSQGDYLVISNYLGSYALGIYSKAYQLMTVPANLIGQVFDQVFFPVMSKIQDDNQQLSNIYILSSSILALIFFPISIAMFLFSEEIILVLLGHDWIKSAIPLRILALSLFFRVGYKINDPLFRAKGAVYNRAFIHMIHAILVLVASIIGIYWNLVGVAVGVVISLIINYVIISIKTYKLIKFDIYEYILGVLPIMILCCGLIPVMFYIKKLLNLLISNVIIYEICSVGILCILLIILILFVFYFVLPDIKRKQIINLVKSTINERGK